MHSFCRSGIRVGVVMAVTVALSGVAGTALGATGAATGRATPAMTAGRAPAHRPLTVGEALAQARSSGRAVPVTGATTPRQTLTANPDGSLTLNESQVPVRKLVGGTWKALDPALRRGSGGSVSPAVSTGGLRLSGGGSGPLAVMSALAKSMSVWFPVPLPAPVLSGSTATYPDVLPGVDLQVTAGPQGGFSEVVVVQSAAAAANPLLRRLVLAVQAPGLRLAADGSGDITVDNPGGHVIFAAPAPQMWDSATAPAPGVFDPLAGQVVDARSGLPLASSVGGPGEAAHRAGVKVAVSGGSLVLTPDAGLLEARSTVYPVYIDPTFTSPSAGSSRSTWATENNYYINPANYKTSGLLQVGDQAWSAPYFLARSWVTMPIPSQIYGSSVRSAQLNFTEEWSPSCTAKPVQLWLTGAFNSSITWASQPKWITDMGTQTVAHGYNSSCPAAGVGFGVTSAIQSAVNGKWPTATFGLRAGNESDPLGWKQFANTASMSIKYDHAPNTPAGLTTSPSTSCTATTPTTVGDGNVSLYVPVSDQDDTGSLQGAPIGVILKLWDTATGAAFPGTPTSPQQLYVPSGSTAVFTASKADLESIAGGAVTEFSWQAQAYDYSMYSGWSAVCHFYFDPTRPGQPMVTPPASAHIAQPATFTIAPPASGTVPTDYIYQLNAGPPATVTASSTGNATITVVPGRFSDSLTVTSQSAGGNIGDTAYVPFTAAPAATAAGSDLTGDGHADLLAAGSPGGNGLPPGLWLAAGSGNGQVLAGVTDVGAEGNGSVGDNSPADFTGAQVISGHFNGTGLQDVMAYYPSGANAGQANILFGTGDGSAIQAQLSGNSQELYAGTFEDYNLDEPLQIANAGNTSGQGFAYPDLIAINGDSMDGYYLEFYPNSDGLGDNQVPDPLATATPAGGMDWNHWVIATAQVPSGTAMYLWDPSTGALYLWEGLAYNMNTGAFSYTQYTIANGSSATWNKGASLGLQAADINGDNVPDLWTVAPHGLVTAYLATLGSGTASLAAAPAQVLVPPSHTWLLNDAASGTVTTAADTVGSPALTATASGNAMWATGDLFSPAVSLNGTSSALASSGPAVDPAKDFSVSAWVKPATLGGTLLSQDMTSAASFRVYADATTGNWYFCMATSDSATASYNCATGSSANVGLGGWTHLTVTYRAATGAMGLYENGTLVGSGSHAALSGTTGGGLQIGDYRSGSGHTGYFSGLVADVVTYAGPLTTAQIAAIDTGTIGAVGPITSGMPGKCVDDWRGGTQDGTKIDLYSCNATTPQVWTMQEDGTVRALGKCLTASGGGTANGTLMVLSTCIPGNASQQWNTGSASSLVNSASGKCLDDPASSTTNGVQLQLYTCNGGSNQKWRPPYDGPDPAGAFDSGVAGKCIDDWHSGTGNGNKIDIYSCNGTGAQDLTLPGDGTVRVLGKCLDNRAGGSANGNPIQLWACIPGNPNQQWQPGPTGGLVNPATGKCLDDPGATSTNGTQLQLYTCNGTKAQVWTVPATTVPGVVTSLKVAAGTGQATVSWLAPAITGGSSLTYTVTASPGGASVSGVTGTFATVTGLTSGTAYTFTVTAANAVGTGPASAPTTPVTVG